MPPRYQQNRLASSQVGTPGLDKAASEGAAAVAKAASSFRQSIDPIQEFFLGEASKDFTQLKAMGMQKQREVAYYKKQEDAALLELGIHEAKNNASIALKKRQNEIQADYADRPILGEQVFNKEVDQVIAQSLPPDLKPREQAMYKRRLSDERRQSVESINSWRHQTQRDSADKQFTSGLEDFKALAGSQGNTGDFVGFKQALDRWSGPEALNRAYLLRKDKGVAEVKAALSDAHANFVIGLGLRDPKKGYQLADEWFKSGSIQKEALIAVRGELEKQENRLYTLQQRQKAEKEVQMSDEIGIKYDTKLQQNVKTGNVEEAESILGSAITELALKENDGKTDPIYVRELRKFVHAAQGSVQRTKQIRLEGPRTAVLLNSLATQNRYLDQLAVYHAQETPKSIELRANFGNKFKMMHSMYAGWQRGEVSDSMMVDARDQAKAAFEEAKSANIIDIPHHGKAKETEFDAEFRTINDKLRFKFGTEVEQAQSIQSRMQRGTERLFRMPLMTPVEQERFFTTDAYINGPPPAVRGAIRQNNPTWSDFTVNGWYADEVATSVSSWKQVNPGTQLTEDVFKRDILQPLNTMLLEGIVKNAANPR